MKKAKAKKGVNPLVAILFLVGSGGLAAKQFLGSELLGSTPGGPAAGAAAGDGLVMPDGPGQEVAVQDATSWRDLLAAYGSFGIDQAVRVAFSVLADAPKTPAAPVAETQPQPVGSWAGDDPPELSLGVVMISTGARRAVLGGRVVGLGDAIGEGEVAAIEPGVVRLRWHGRELTYDLEDGWPREFRAERARRGTASDEDGVSAPATESQDKANQEEGK